MTESYLTRVANHARTTIKSSLYSGREFEDLAQRLSQSQKSPGENGSANSIEEDETPVALLYELEANKLLHAVPVTSTSGEAVFREQANHNRMIFLLGYPSAQLMNALGTRYEVDPEFYRRHLSHNSQPKGTTTASNSPAFILPSFERSIFQLSITTVGRRDERSVETLQKLRETTSNDIDGYLHQFQLDNGWRSGDSVVRTYDLHDKNTFSIEQQATMYVREDPQRKGQWIVFVWFDSGRDLVRSPPGPWTASYSSWAEFRPVVFYKPGIALKSHDVVNDVDQATNPFNCGLPAMPQSLDLLTSFYAKSLGAQEMSSDPLYALDELFKYFQVSEMQLFNVIAQDLERATRASRKINSEDSIHAQDTFIHYRLFLQKHVRRIASTLDFLREDSTRDWPSTPSEKSERARMSLRQDLQYLLQSGQALEQQCEREIGILMSTATIAETRNAQQLTARSYRWAVLAAAYVPLSWTTSIFGMNFVAFKHTRTGIWAWMVVTLPVLVASLVLITCNPKKVKEMVKKLLGP